jgi:sugar phosphate isomerase/epimerase
MKLSLSVRIAESPTRKDQTAVPLEDLVTLAHRTGYEGMCIRASVVSVDSPLERVAEVRELLDRHGLAVSMVTGDVPLAANDAEATKALRNVTPYLDLAERLGSTLIRVMMHEEDDIPHAQRAADEASERGIRLAHQMHWGTLFETAEDALDVAQRVGRPGFGVTYEPANLLVCGSPYGPDTIARLAPHILNVYFQNLRIDPDGGMPHPTRRLGLVRGTYVPVGDTTAIDVRAEVAGLKAIGYDGWFTIHQPLRPGQSVPEAVAEAYDAVAPLL